MPFYPKPSYTSGHPDSYDFEQAKAFGRKMAFYSPEFKNQKGDQVATPKPVSSEEWIQDSKRLTRETLGQVFPKLTVNTDTCIRCHMCEKDCPVGGIDVKIDPPRIQNPCIYCWRCANICPTLSIGADWDTLVSMAPENYARYKKELDEVAARGKFRWLVDPTIINLDDPLYKQREREVIRKQKTNNKPPRVS